MFRSSFSPFPDISCTVQKESVLSTLIGLLVFVLCSVAAVTRIIGEPAPRIRHRLLGLAKRPRLHELKCAMSRVAFARCGTDLSNVYSREFLVRVSMAQARIVCQIHRALCSTASSRVRHCSCWIRETFVARLDRPAVPARSSRRTS